jgi:hypothetical protein
MLRRLSFKLPIVLRYTTMLVLMTGMIHSVIAHRSRFKLYIPLAPLVAAGLCYEEIGWWLGRLKNE